MTDPPPQHPATGHEDRDINVRAVLGFAGVLVVVAVVVHVVLAWMFFALLGGEEDDKRSRYPLSVPEHAALPQTTFGSPATGVLPNEPRLERLDLAGQESRKDTAEDRPGAVHIPIEQAMRLVAEESRPQGHEPAAVRYDAGIPGTGGRSNSGRTLPEARP